MSPHRRASWSSTARAPTVTTSPTVPSAAAPTSRSCASAPAGGRRWGLPTAFGVRWPPTARHPRAGRDGAPARGQRRPHRVRGVRGRPAGREARLPRRRSPPAHLIPLHPRPPGRARARVLRAGRRRPLPLAPRRDGVRAGRRRPDRLLRSRLGGDALVRRRRPRRNTGRGVHEAPGPLPRARRYAQGAVVLYENPLRDVRARVRLADHSVRRMKVAIVGTGYVGVVTGACLASLGHEITCVDSDPRRAALVAGGEAPFHEPGLAERLGAALECGRLRVAGSVEEAVRDSDVSILAVGTPFGGERIDLGAIEAGATAVGRALREAN